MKPATRKRAWNNSAFAYQSKFDSVQTENATPVKESNVADDEKTIEIKTSNESPQTSKPAPPSSKSNSNWIDKFEPKTCEEVAVHPKKLAELKDWLLHCTAVHKQHPAQICLLTGPSGSGKTAAVRALARAQKYELQEWINPVDRDMINTLGDQTSNYTGSQIDFFKSFLFRSSRYKSLLGSQKRLVLVEDFPNMILSSVDIFEDILEEFSKYGKAPLLFIVADSKSRSLNISYNLFTEELKNKYHIHHISFNSIAVTLLQKAMKRFCGLMREQQFSDTYKVPSETIIDSIVFAAQGDIRNALINLHFASLKGAGALPTERVESCEIKGKSKKKISTLKTIRRDESVTMLHALGRVFNPKRLPNGNFTHKPEDITDSFASEPKRFIDLIHANYLPHFREIEHVVEAANALSIADNIITEYREEALALTALNLAVHSIMQTNESPVTAWMPIRAARRNHQDLSKSQKISGISNSLYATDYGSYVQMINGCKKIKK
ncbi:cell cycle checkpoint protein RAD17 isoform X1 [Bactrocera neohumeralis]|uniref:cell cycle checkpoint protein RAD17 isoform X1 n=1 Tax=Bactrocera neohumeralis TaxID=98809 RepID=UPI002165C036|nr:cell cycle checkpoint protein RAD17 isoform X1 [Bactrocera neohumeralis]